MILRRLSPAERDDHKRHVPNLQDGRMHRLTRRCENIIHPDADSGYWIVQVFKDDRDNITFTTLHRTQSVDMRDGDSDLWSSPSK